MSFTATGTTSSSLDEVGRSISITVRRPGSSCVLLPVVDCGFGAGAHAHPLLRVGSSLRQQQGGPQETCTYLPRSRVSAVSVPDPVDLSSMIRIVGRVHGRLSLLPAGSAREVLAAGCFAAGCVVRPCASCCRVTLFPQSSYTRVTFRRAAPPRSRPELHDTVAEVPEQITMRPEHPIERRDLFAAQARDLALVHVGEHLVVRSLHGQPLS